MILCNTDKEFTLMCKVIPLPWKKLEIKALVCLFCCCSECICIHCMDARKRAGDTSCERVNEGNLGKIIINREVEMQVSQRGCAAAVHWMNLMFCELLKKHWQIF